MQTLGILKRNIKTKNTAIRTAAYQTLVRLQVEYTSTVFGVKRVLSLGITVRHQSASLVLPNSYPRDGIFSRNLTTINASVICNPCPTNNFYLSSIFLYVLTAEGDKRRVPVNQVLGVNCFFFCAMLVVLVVSDRSQCLPYNAERQAS